MNIFTPQGSPRPGEAYLKPTEFMDFDKPIVRDFAASVTADATGECDRAVKLYYAVRDRIRYNPFTIRLTRESFKASHVLEAGESYCIPKAILLAACARSVGIMAGIGLSDVVNHLCTPKLRKMMGGTELFIHHGYAVLFIDGKWVKAAPAFNIEMCDRFDVTPTEFDGRQNAVLQEFDKNARKHMQYLRDHGIWSDLPYHRVVEEFGGYYPSAFFHEQQEAAAFTP